MLLDKLKKRLAKLWQGKPKKIRFNYCGGKFSNVNLELHLTPDTTDEVILKRFPKLYGSITYVDDGEKITEKILTCTGKIEDIGEENDG